MSDEIIRPETVNAQMKIVRMRFVYKCVCPICSKVIYCNDSGKLDGICSHFDKVDLDTLKMGFKKE